MCGGGGAGRCGERCLELPAGLLIPGLWKVNWPEYQGGELGCGNTGTCLELLAREHCYAYALTEKSSSSMWIQKELSILSRRPLESTFNI
ncbi:uncharacterized protein RNPC3-DT [Hylobates moloch]|uniref:uncharacterized protein RNPC3-DT n=1 Tax=Hylobates moloch TaxID=81572 RepID=UPI0026773EE9|nr:uncharacterized protein RNPC3-DT [Hylobates moloch]